MSPTSARHNPVSLPTAEPSDRREGSARPPGALSLHTATSLIPCIFNWLRTEGLRGTPGAGRSMGRQVLRVVLGLWVLLTLVMAPLKLYLCVPMAMGVSLTPHTCCIKRHPVVAQGQENPRGASLSRERKGCCEQIKDAQGAQPTLLAQEPLLDLASVGLPLEPLPMALSLVAAARAHELPSLSRQQTRALVARGPPPPLASPTPLFIAHRSLLC